MIPVVTEYAKQKALELAKKKLGFDYVPSGIALKRDLGLIDYKYVWLQKVINHSTNVFIITYNSRFPTLYISRRDLETAKTARIFKARKHGSEYELENYRITPGILIEEYVSRLPSNSMLIVRDLTGERFIESFTYSNNKLKLLKEEE